MLQKTKAIVLKTIKYSDNSVITTFYSKELGKISVIIKSLHSKKSITKVNYLQPFFILDVELYHKENRNIQKAKEIKPSYNFKTLPFNVVKLSLAMFLSEIVNKSIKEEETNKELYNYLEKTIEFIDVAEKNISNFHLIFLLHLSKFLGFFPQNNFGDKNWFFDIEKAIFVDYKNNFNQLELPDSKIISNLLNYDFENFYKINLSKAERNKTLQNILLFYSKQIPEFGKIKSLEVMQAIFD